MARDETCRVLRNAEVGAGYRHLVLESASLAVALAPGQFVHVRVPTLESSALRRPFSVFEAASGRVELLYKTVGRGTDALARVREGEKLSVLGPLGRGFPPACSGTALLVGGGYGVAPLYFLARRMLSVGTGIPRLFVGARTKADLLALDRFAELGVPVSVATNDGSAGTGGFVTVPLDEAVRELRRKGEEFTFYACGPDGMLRAVAERAMALGSRGWISMDRHMVCGVGACYACIQRTVHGNERCCVDGPVFKAEDLIW